MLRVTGGALQGVTKESVLAVHPRPGGQADAKEILGYVRVTDAGPSHADVEPCPHGGRKAVSADDLPEGGVCQVVERGLGRFTLKLAVTRPTAEQKAKDPATYAVRLKRCGNVDAALKELAGEPDVGDLFEVTGDEAAADWILGVEPLFEKGVRADDRVLLWQGLGAPLDATMGQLLKQQENDPVLKPLPKPRQVYGGYQADDVRRIRAGLRADLQKIYTWRNLWRIAGVGQAAATSARAGSLRLELLRRDKSDGPPEGQLTPGALVRSGQLTEIHLVNDGIEANFYVALVFLDADFGINVLHTSLPSGETKKIKGRVVSKVAGPEGVLVFAVPIATNKQEPRFDFLKQFPLQEVEQTRSRGVPDPDKDPKTPFSRLMKAARVGKGTRTYEFDSPDNPIILSWSWTVVP
jgi:hypothetical protein